MGVVEIQRMAERAVEQGRHRRRPGLGVAEHGGLALAVERERFEHLEQRRRGFRVTPRPDRAAEKIQRQHLGAFQHLERDILEFQVGDVGGEGCGFICHGGASFVLARSCGPILVGLWRRAVNIGRTRVSPVNTSQAATCRSMARTTSR